MSDKTLREHLIAIRDRHITQEPFGIHEETVMDAIGGLIILDNAEAIGVYIDPRDIEPEEAIANLHTNGMRLVFDPPVSVGLTG